MSGRWGSRTLGLSVRAGGTRSLAGRRRWRRCRAAFGLLRGGRGSCGRCRSSGGGGRRRCAALWGRGRLSVGLAVAWSGQCGRWRGRRSWRCAPLRQGLGVPLIRPRRGIASGAGIRVAGHGAPEPERSIYQGCDQQQQQDRPHPGRHKVYLQRSRRPSVDQALLTASKPTSNWRQNIPKKALRHSRIARFAVCQVVETAKGFSLPAPFRRPAILRHPFRQALDCRVCVR